MASSRKKHRWDEQCLWLTDRSKEWKAPAVVYEDSQWGTGYEPLGCSGMNVSVDCYFSSVIITIRGEWINYLPETEEFAFVFRPHGKVTKCKVKIKGKYVQCFTLDNDPTHLELKVKEKNSHVDETVCCMVFCFCVVVSNINYPFLVLFFLLQNK